MFRNLPDDAIPRFIRANSTYITEYVMSKLYRGETALLPPTPFGNTFYSWADVCHHGDLFARLLRSDEPNVPLSSVKWLFRMGLADKAAVYDFLQSPGSLTGRDIPPSEFLTNRLNPGREGVLDYIMDQIGTDFCPNDDPSFFEVISLWVMYDCVCLVDRYAKLLLPCCAHRDVAGLFHRTFSDPRTMVERGRYRQLGAFFKVCRMHGECIKTHYASDWVFKFFMGPPFLGVTDENQFLWDELREKLPIYFTASKAEEMLHCEMPVLDELLRDIPSPPLPSAMTRDFVQDLHPPYAGKQPLTRVLEWSGMKCNFSDLSSWIGREFAVQWFYAFPGSLILGVVPKKVLANSPSMFLAAIGREEIYYEKLYKTLRILKDKDVKKLAGRLVSRRPQLAEPFFDRMPLLLPRRSFRPFAKELLRPAFDALGVGAFLSPSASPLSLVDTHVLKLIFLKLCC